MYHLSCSSTHTQQPVSNGQTPPSTPVTALQASRLANRRHGHSRTFTPTLSATSLFPSPVVSTLAVAPPRLRTRAYMHQHTTKTASPFQNRHVYTLDTEFGQPRATRPNLFPVQKSTCLHTRYGVRSAARTHTHTHGLQTQARSDSHRQIRQGHWYYHRHSHSSFSDGIPGLHCNTHAASPPESRTNPSPYLRPSLTDRYPGIKARRQRHTGLSCTATNSFSPGQSHSFTALASRFRVHTTQRHPHRSPHSSTVHAQARTPGESSCYNRPFTTLGRGRCLANPVFGLRMHWQTLTAQAAKAPSADTLRHLGLMRRSSSH